MADAGESMSCLVIEGMQAVQAGDHGRASDLFSKLSGLDAASDLWPCMQARALLQQANAEAALAAAERRLAQSPSCAELLLLQGLAMLRLGRSEAARAGLLRAARLGGLPASHDAELRAALAEIGESGPGPAAVTVPTPSPAPAPAPPTPATAPTSAAYPAAQQTQQAPPARPPAAAAAPSPPPAPASSAGENEAIKAVSRATAAETKGLLLEARQHCEEALSHSPGFPQAVLCLARLELAGSGGGRAAAKLLKEKYPQVLKKRPHCVEAHTLLATAWEDVGDWDSAVTELETASRLAQQAGEPREQILGRLARAQWRAGEPEAAAELAQKVLEGTPTQREACEVACEILLRREDRNNAISLMLRCLIAHRQASSKESADLVCGVMRHCGVEELIGVMAPSGEKQTEENKASVAEVTAYVGLILKERSEVAKAAQSYRAAVLLAPLHASLCLNLMHTYALRRDSLRALAFGLRYFSKLPAVQAAKLVCAWVAGEPHEQGPGYQPLAVEQFKNAASFYDSVAIGFVVLKLLFLAYPYCIPGAPPSSGGEAQPPWRKRLLSLDIEGEPSGTKVASLLDSTAALHGADAAAQAEAHRDVLKGLCSALRGSAEGRDLHLTPVRNEHAYFSCIQDILCLPSPALGPSSGPPAKLYALGDSHVLPLAWRVVDVKEDDSDGSSRHVIVPCLVTGVKLWHMRPQSKFYTKFNFWDQVSGIPAGAPVVLLLGEIDCREGILRAVQKGRHATIEAALLHVVDLYTALLREVRQRMPGSLIFVHPVANVLPETRFLTLAFNRMLASPKVRAAMEKVDVRLLEFQPMLQGGVPDPAMPPKELAKLELVPELTLDGTHVNPSYVDSHLAPALRNCWPQ